MENPQVKYPYSHTDSLSYIKTIQDVSALKNAPGVKNVRPIREFSIPKYVSYLHINKRLSKIVTEAFARPVSKHIVSGPSDPALSPDTEATHIATVRAPLPHDVFPKDLSIGC